MASGTIVQDEKSAPWSAWCLESYHRSRGAPADPEILLEAILENVLHYRAHPPVGWFYRRVSVELTVVEAGTLGRRQGVDQGSGRLGSSISFMTRFSA